MSKAADVSYLPDRVHVEIRTKESDGLAAVEKTMVVGERDDHDRADDDLPVERDGALVDSVHTYLITRQCTCLTPSARITHRARRTAAS